jgi:HSP20 family protein
MTKVAFHTNLPQFFNRDEFLTPFDRLFDKVMENQFPNFTEEFGVKCFEGGAYPKVNVYDYEDKIGIIAEIPGLTRNQVNIEVEDNILTISGDKHNIADDKTAKVIRRELKHSSFKRSFQLSDQLNGDKVFAKFEDGILSINILKTEPEKPKKTFVKIS